MEQINTSFPSFKPGQVLTSDALNKSFGYVEQQTRLTRTEILGNGIFKGLEYTFNNGALTINKGVAVTPNGYLISINSDTTYSVAVKKATFGRHPVNNTRNDNLPAIEYFLYKDKDDAILHGHNISDFENLKSLNGYIVAIAIDFFASEEIICSEVSCDIVQANQQIEYRPVIIKAENIRPLTTKLTTVKAQCGTKRLINLSNATNVKLLNKKTKSLFSSLKKDILSVADAIDKEIPLTIWSTLLDELNPSYSRYCNFCTHLKTFGQNMTEVPEYYLLHLNDLGAALNEFINFYNEFANKYPFVPTNREPYPRVVILGKGNNSETTSYRQQYCQLLFDKDFVIGRERFEKLFKRIFLLSENFIGGNFQQFRKATCLFTWQLPSSKLGEHAIPYYYKESPALLECWNPFQSPLYNQASYYTSPNNTNSIPMMNGVMMLHRHYECDASKVANAINDYIKQNDLPIKVTTIKLYPKKFKKGYKNSIINGDIGKEEKIKGIKDLKAILDKANNLQEIDKETMDSVANDLEKFITYKYGVPGSKSRNYQKKDLLAISAIHSYLEFSHNENCKNAIMIGGCPYNGNLILLHHNNHVLLSIGTAK